MFSTENLRVGDKVIVVHKSVYSGKVRYVGEIIKKTPAGRVDVKYCDGCPKRYYKDGSCYATASSYLEEYSKEAEEEILRQKKLQRMQRWLKEFDYTKLSYKEAEQVYKLVVGFKEI